MKQGQGLVAHPHLAAVICTGAQRTRRSGYIPSSWSIPMWMHGHSKDMCSPVPLPRDCFPIHPWGPLSWEPDPKPALKHSHLAGGMLSALLRALLFL